MIENPLESNTLFEVDQAFSIHVHAYSCIVFLIEAQ